MRTKNISFIILLLLALGTHYNTHGMLSRTASYQLVIAQPGLSSRFTHDTIRDYQAENDHISIASIALKNLHKLTSDVTEKNRSEILEKEIMSSLKSDKGTISKIYQIDDKPVGFINYYINHTPPWYQRFIPYPVVPNAHINFLAIEDKYQGQGIGTALLKHALKDCHNNSVNIVTLKTTDHDEILKKYYYKFGFEVERTSKSTGVTRFKKRLKPHPMSILSKEFFDWLRKFGE